MQHLLVLQSLLIFKLILIFFIKINIKFKLIIFYSFNANIIDQNGKRERTKFNDSQLQQLEQTFRRCQYPQGHDREQLANRLGLTETKVQVKNII